MHCFADCLVDQGVEHIEALSLIEDIFQQIRRDLGPEIYIATLDKAARDQKIRAEFNGQNAKLLQKKYGISRATIYRVINPALPGEMRRDANKTNSTD